MKMDDYLYATSDGCAFYTHQMGLLTSTATSGSPFFAAPSTTAATISSRYFANVKPSISLINASAGPTKSEDLSLLMRVVCFLRDESRLPGGPIDNMSTRATQPGSKRTKLTPGIVEPVLLRYVEESCSPRILCDVVGRGGHGRPVRWDGECRAARWLRLAEWSEHLFTLVRNLRMVSKHACYVTTWSGHVTHVELPRSPNWSRSFPNFWPTRDRTFSKVLYFLGPGTQPSPTGPWTCSSQEDRSWTGLS